MTASVSRPVPGGTGDDTVTVADMHRTAAEKAAARMDSHVEAVGAVLASLGRRFYVGTGLVDGAGYQVVAVDRTTEAPHPFPPASTDIPALSSQWEYWTCQQSATDWVQAETLLGRYHLLDTAVTVLTDEHAAPMTMAEVFEEDNRSDGAAPALDGLQVTMLAAWWDDRMAEGHTPETARLMLSLTLPPRLVTCVTYDAAGIPTLNPSTP